MDDHLTSDRVATVAAARPFQLLYEFRRLSGYEQRRDEPGVLDFTFGDPHDPPSKAYVEILREALIPKHELWFAYNFGDAKAIEAATFKVDESYPDEAILEVALLPKDSAKVKPQIFFIGLKKFGSGANAKWLVDYWAPYAPPPIPSAPQQG